MKHYFFVILIGIYFLTFFYFKENSQYYSYLKNNFLYFEYGLSVLNAIFCTFFTFSLINILEKNIENYLKKLKNEILGTFIFKFINVSKFIISIYVGLQLLIIPPKYSNFVDEIFKISFILTLIILLNSILDSVFDTVKKNQAYELNKHVIKIVKKVLRVFIWGVGIITIIGNLGYNINALITGAGIGGLALALASQKSVANMFGAISIILNKPFKIGDSIKIGAISGTVRDIGFMYLKITDSNGHEINIPNETIITSAIENFSVRRGRKVDFNLLIDIKTPKEKVNKGFSIIKEYLEILKKDNKIKSFRFSVEGVSGAGINIVGTFFSNNADLEFCNKMKEEFLLDIVEKFESEEIGIL